MRKITLSILLAALPLFAFAATEPNAIVVIDANRGAFIRWPLPAGALPKGGFQIERSVGGKKDLVGIVRPGTAAEADQRFAPEKARLAKKYLEVSPSQSREFTQARLSVELMSLQDPLLARFLALSIEDPKVPYGSTVAYTVTALGENGQPTGVYAVSPLTRVEATPPPFPPGDLRGIAIRKGIALLWSVPGKGEHNPASAITYEIKKREGGKSIVMTPEPVLKMNTDAPGFLDEKPPVEATSSYTITALDIFGRRGPESALTEVFFPDFTALDPPATIESRTADGKAFLVWEAKPNRYRKGWKVVRALQPGAAGEPVTTQTLTTSTFTDSTGRVGTTYYYRVSAINIRNEEGPPMVSQAVLVRSGKAPAAPANLAAELKSGKVILTWDAPPETVAVFQVQRSMNGSEWNLLTRVASNEPRYSDIYPRDATGKVQYRVVAWSYDDTASEPSQTLSVELPDTQPPLPPNIDGIDGTGGQVAIKFTPSGHDATQLFILRSLTFKDTGAVVNLDPLPATARTFTDSNVQAGTLYFYRLVAVDAAGNRSTPTEPATVRVSEPPLPQPAAPRARFETKPFPRVIVEFTPPSSPSVRYALERRDRSGKWLLIQGPFPQDATSAMDTIPQKGSKSAYRLVSIASNGAAGPRSAEIEVNIPK
ncbi:MAG: hypothetical protein M3041_04555 [Acidobacteriota bacterium]|nr:hypothetical protein [Acidobacteriota bacterium]